MALRLGLTMTMAVLTLSLSSTAFGADVAISEEARAHFAAGVNLLQDPDGARYEEAYREFKAAYAASPSWKILGNLGISAMKLERDGEAIEAFKRYLAEGGKQIDAEDRAQFQRDLTTLEAGVVRLTLQSEPPGAVIEDERFPSSGSSIRNSYVLDGASQIGVRAGRHRFVARMPGRVDAVWDVELSPRQQQAYSFKLPAPAASPVTSATPPPSAPAPLAPDAHREPVGNGMRIGAYVALGVGAVGLGAGTFFAMGARSSFEQANDLADEVCGNADPCELGERYGQWEQHGDDGSRKKTLSVVGFVVGGLGVATGVTLLVLSSRKKEQPAAAQMEPYLGLGSLGVRGSF